MCVWTPDLSQHPTLRIIIQVPEGDYEGQADVPLHVINNYFSIGADAQIALEFHTERGRLGEKGED